MNSSLILIYFDLLLRNVITGDHISKKIRIVLKKRQVVTSEHSTKTVLIRVRSVTFIPGKNISLKFKREHDFFCLAPGGRFFL